MPLLDRYRVLLEQIQHQESALQAFNKRKREFEKIWTDREVDMTHPVLLPSLYDPLRNSAARTFRLAEIEQSEKQKIRVLTSEPNFVAPFLSRHARGEDVRRAYDDCLRKMELEHRSLVDELKQIHEEVSTLTISSVCECADPFIHTFFTT